MTGSVFGRQNHQVFFPLQPPQLPLPRPEAGDGMERRFWRGLKSLVRLDISESCYSAMVSCCSAEYQAPNPCALERPAGNVSQAHDWRHPSQQASQVE
jgi:hypothetical protein